MADIDIFALAAQRVENKGITMRIRHSAKFHSLRSALASLQTGRGGGSAMSKGAALLGMGGRAALKLIPIPVVGDLLGGAQKAVEDWYRKTRHQNARSGTVPLETTVKFKLKDLSVEEADRYRWKLAEAITELRKAQGVYEEHLTNKTKDGKVCHAYLEMADAIEQAMRRFTILDNFCATMITTMNECKAWCVEQKTHIESAKTDFQTKFAAALTEENTQVGTKNASAQGSGDLWQGARHANCVHYCAFRQVQESDDWAAARREVASYANLLSTGFAFESFVTADPETYQVKKS